MGFIHKERPKTIKGLLGVALDDLVQTLTNFRLVTVFGWQDIRQRYRLSLIGPFWITLSMAIMIGAMGLVFSQVLKSPMGEYFPFLAVGLIFWTFISTMVTEGCTVFTSVEGIVRQMPIPFFVYILRTYWRNTIILGHNLIILPFVFLLLSRGIDWNALIVIPGFVLLSLNLIWINIVCGILSTRFRDCTQIINSLLQVAFYVTPVIWMPSAIPGRAASMILDPNPLYHLFCLVRDPLLGATPSFLSWGYCAVMAVLGWILALILLGRSKNRIAYWL